MAGERIYPILPCPDLTAALGFYEKLGFAVTYRQQRPNPYAVVAFEDLQIHLAEIAEFDATTSVGSAVVVVPELEATYATFTSGLRHADGRVPTAGIPRVLRIRRKAGTATGFTVVDPGGNWLRFYAEGSTEDSSGATGLARVLETAARQGDARGDVAQAIAVLDAGLARHPDADPYVRAEALAYREELLERLRS